MSRIRIKLAIALASVVVVGFTARSFRAEADPSSPWGFLATYLGDALWPVMFFLIARLMWPAARTLPLAVGVLAFTLTIEFLQLWHPPFLQWLRAQPVIGFALGHTFLWSDVVCLFAGSLLISPLVDWLIPDASQPPLSG